MIAHAGSVSGREVTRRRTPAGGNDAGGRYRTVGLSEITLEALVPVKVTLSRFGSQDHNRWVFRSAGCDAGVYYKIWNPTYIRRDNLAAAIACGFVDDHTVPALDGLVFHDGILRGYIMRACRRERDLLDETFRELMYARTRSTGHFFVQLSDHHVMRLGHLRSLVDLEGIYPMDKLPRLSELNCRFEDPRYAEVVLDHYHNMYRATVDIKRLCRDPAEKRRGRATRVLRRIKRTIRNRFPRTDLIRPR